MTCGHLLVPENRAAATTHQHETSLAVVIFEPDRERHDPVVFLSGGPGQPAGIATADDIDEWWQFINEQAWLRGRRLIVFDQRGVGLSQPALDCSAFFDSATWDETLTRPNDNRDFSATKKSEVQSCRRSLIAKGIDLSAFNTRESAADVADLRTGLGIRQWVLYGVSYGTEVAMVTLASHPEGISAAILDSVLPPQTDYLAEDGRNLADVLAILEADCRRDVRCKADGSQLSTMTKRAVEQLNAAPIVLRIDPDGGDRPVYKRVSGDVFLEFLFDAFYDRDMLPMLPLVIEATYNQNYQPLAELIGVDDDDEKMFDGLGYSVTCTEAPRGELDRKTPGYMVNWAKDSDYAVACPIWLKDRPLDPLPKAMNAYVPVLFLSGEYDPATPARWAAAVAAHLPASRAVLFRGTGHDVIDSTSCGSDVVAGFLVKPAAPIEAPCLATLSGPDFLPADSSDWQLAAMVAQIDASVRTATPWAGRANHRFWRSAPLQYQAAAPMTRVDERQ